MKKSIYILSDGKLKREEDTICFISKTGKKFLPVTLVRELYIFGEVEVNKRCLEFLAKNQILVHFYNYYGFYVGSFYPREFYNAGIITLKQSEHYLDKNKRLYLAKRFVEGALKNMMVNLRYYSKRGVPLEPIYEKISLIAKGLENRTSVGQLMADEGNAREAYYTSFNFILKSGAFTMERREKRPPTTRLNALISFGNSLMYTTVLSEIYKTHLDPRIGYLHSTNMRKFSLSLDVAEIYKPIVVDRVIFSLINKKMLDERSFTKELNGVFLNNKGKEVFLREFEKKLNTSVKLKERRVVTSYRRLIRIELYKLEKHLLGEKDYKPYISRW